MKANGIDSCAGLIAYIQEIGILPLLPTGIRGWSADAVVDDDCRYTVLPDGGWEWPLWKWKGEILRSGIAYGKFIGSKAGFVSLDLWPDFCNLRRSVYPEPEEGSIEEAIIFQLNEAGSAITRDLRRQCGFTGPKMRSRFDSYVTKLQMACRIVTEDFVYPTDRHGKEYGWGWALLTTPETLFGKSQCRPSRTPEESYQRLLNHFHKILPHLDDETIKRILGTH